MHGFMSLLYCIVLLLVCRILWSPTDISQLIRNPTIAILSYKLFVIFLQDLRRMTEQCNVIDKVKVCQSIVYPVHLSVRTMHLLPHDEINDSNKEERKGDMMLH